MPGKKSNKDKSMAADLKKHHVERTSGACPWGCGRLVTNGGGGLMQHLNVCRGKRSVIGR